MTTEQCDELPDLVKQLPGGWVVRSRDDLEPGAVDVEGPGFARLILTAGVPDRHQALLHALLCSILRTH